jgi:hypothetical protein
MKLFGLREVKWHVPNHSVNQRRTWHFGTPGSAQSLPWPPEGTFSTKRPLPLSVYWEVHPRLRTDRGARKIEARKMQGNDQALISHVRHEACGQAEGHWKVPRQEHERHKNSREKGRKVLLHSWSLSRRWDAGPAAGMHHLGPSPATPKDVP